MTRARRPPAGTRVKHATYKTNYKFETRNPKQFQIVKHEKIPNKPVSDFVIGIYALSLFWSAGPLSIFGFRILIRWRPFDGVPMSNIVPPPLRPEYPTFTTLVLPK